MKGMKRYSPVLVLALLALLAGCGGQAAPEAEATASTESDVVAEAEPVSAQEPAPDAQARGQAAMREFGDRLRNELRAAMSEDGAAGAVSFCHDQAPRIADEVMADAVYASAAEIVFYAQAELDKLQPRSRRSGRC